MTARAPSRWIGPLGWGMAVTLGSVGMADPVCAPVVDMAGAADPTGSGAAVLPGTRPDCAALRELGWERSVICSWSFPYQHADARDAFAMLVDTLPGCFGSGAVMVADQGVNHPDSYDLGVLDLGGRAVAVSIKDKAALSRTIVSIRVREGAAPGSQGGD